ncbi:unnamed protein product [Arabidopsis halleri]
MPRRAVPRRTGVPHRAVPCRAIPCRDRKLTPCRAVDLPCRAVPLDCHAVRVMGVVLPSQNHPFLRDEFLIRSLVDFARSRLMSRFSEDYVREELERDEYRQLELSLDSFGADQNAWIEQTEPGDTLDDLTEEDA